MHKLITRALFLTAGLFCFVANGSSQSVGIGTTTPDASAQLDVSNTSKGILIPRQTSAQRSAISNPATGLLVFQTDGTPGFYYYNGVAWVNITNGSQVNSQGVSSAYGFTTTLAGSGTFGAVNGVGTAASFNNPYGVATDISGNIYVADQGNNLIRKISSGGLVTTLAGSGASGSADGTGTAATFYFPTGVAADASGNIYVADSYNHKIRKITPDGVVSTLAGSGSPGAADGTGTAASFNYPNGVATDAAGNVYVADAQNNKIRKISAAGVVTTLAGSGTSGSADGTGTAATFNIPTGVATDASGNVYVADKNNYKIRMISSAGVVTTFAGTGTAGSADGTGTAASFNLPTGIATDALNNVYIADFGNQKIRKITPAAVVTTLSGSGAQGATDGTSTSATFYFPYGIATDVSGNVYVGDRNNHKIRKIIAQ